MKIEEALTMIGTKFYQMKSENEYHVIRIMSVNMKKSKDDNIVFNTIREENGEIIEEDYYEKALNEWWYKLIPDGLITFMIVRMNTETSKYDDVIVSTYRAEILKNDIQIPDVLLRQNVLDVLSGRSDYVGTCISSKDMEDTDIYNDLMYMSSIVHMFGINIYINDTMDDILKILGDKQVEMFDKVLEKNFKDYINSSAGLDMGQKHTKGHCRDLRTLLEINNYSYMNDRAFHIIPVKIKIDDYLEHVKENDIEYDIINKELMEELMYLFQKKISKAIALEYDHDIDLTALPKDSIIMLRSIDGRVWIIRIIYDGEFLETEMDKTLLARYMEDINVVAKYGSGKAKI